METYFMFEIEFRVACGRGDDIRPYLKKYPSFINCIGPFGWTPLFYAVRSNQIEVVKVLLEKGANPFVCDKDGLTVLDLAMKNEYRELHTLLKIEMGHRTLP
jgi:ankyrin repeat protein